MKYLDTDGDDFMISERVFFCGGSSSPPITVFIYSRWDTKQVTSSKLHLGSLSLDLQYISIWYYCTNAANAVLI